jgi:hypothetical protein
MDTILMSFQKPMMAPLGQVTPESMGWIACCGKTDTRGLIVCCAH